MPGTVCSIASCKSNALKAKKEGEQISFHTFPEDTHIRNQWIAKCQRTKEFSANYKRICSKHFRDEDYEDALQAKLLNIVPRKLKKDAIPTLNIGTSESQTVPLITKLLEPSEIKVEPCTFEEITIDGPNVTATLKPDNSYSNLHRMYLGAKYENEQLKKRLAENENHFVTLHSRNEELQKMVNEFDSSFYSKMQSLLSTFLTSNQLDIVLNKKTKSRWSTEEISKAFTLRYLSKRAYIYVREILKYPLPGVSTLQRWASNRNLRSRLLIDISKVMEIYAQDKDAAAEGKSLLLADEVAAIRASIEQFQTNNSDQQSDRYTSDQIDAVPENLFRKYTETDSRPLTPAPTIASNYTRASASRRCVTPDPMITSQFKEKTRLILDLRRSHSQDTLSWFGGNSNMAEAPIIRIQQVPTRSITPESNITVLTGMRKRTPRSLQPSPVCKKGKPEMARPKTEFSKTRNESSKMDSKLPKIYLEVPAPIPDSTAKKSETEKDIEAEEEVMRRRGKKRHRKSRDLSKGPPGFETSADPETQVATIGIDSHNPSARTSLVPNGEQNLDDPNATDKRKSSLDVNSYLDKEILRQLRRELNEEIVDNEFDLKRRKALEEALKTVQSNKVVCDELKSLQNELKIPVINVDFWLSLPRMFSRSSARFEVPMDSTMLSSMTPMDYIKEHISVTSSRKLLYNCIFNRHKIECEEDEERERLMSGKEIPAALGEMMGHPLTPTQLKSFQDLVGWSEEENFDFKTFCGLCALCERILAPEYYTQLPSKKTDPCHEIEVADFESLERRLRGQTPDERLKKILFAIKNS